MDAFSTPYFVLNLHNIFCSGSAIVEEAFQDVLATPPSCGKKISFRQMLRLAVGRNTSVLHPGAAPRQNVILNPRPFFLQNGGKDCLNGCDR